MTISNQLFKTHDYLWSFICVHMTIVSPFDLLHDQFYSCILTIYN